MFKGNNKYIWIFAVVFTIVVMVQYILPKPVNWQRTYMMKDKSPFGTYAIHQLLEPAFTKEIEINRGTLYNLKYDLDKRSCLILMDNSISLSKTDMKTMYQFLEAGNTVFIGASKFEGLLADTFHVRTYSKYFTFFEKPDSLIKRPGVKVKMLASNLKNKIYDYPMLSDNYYYRNFDSTIFSTCALMDSSSMMIETKIGSGRLILMSMPDVFTNYFIAKHKNREFAYAILSHITMHSKRIIWDENYKVFNVQSASFLKLILESDALYTAYILMLITLIIYMISDGRRRQRAIPIIEPVKNTTLEFVNVVSHVYFNSDNHTYIAEERVRYFYETIRKRFGVPTSEINDIFLETISDLSGYDPKLVKQLFTYCETLRSSHTATERDLIELNRQITNFNNKSLR